MAVKKTPQQTVAKKNQKSTPSIKVRIDRMVDYQGSHIRAIASANIGGAFAIHGIKVIDSEKGLFVSMPQSKYEQDGITRCLPPTKNSSTWMKMNRRI